MKIFLFILSFVLVNTALADGALDNKDAAKKLAQLTVMDVLQQAAVKAKQQGRQANSLVHESSPYLLQHAYNPVDWLAWGDEAFAKAKKENKPIFLSIGYSTCHWCHVMARESFENDEIAAILNKYFISIKVDREQRPDIDAIYMSATQLINGSGGWPMSVFLDNQLRPFHAATYYPAFSTDGRTGLKDVLLKLHELWSKQPDLVKQVASNVTQRITEQADDTAKSENMAADINLKALYYISKMYDEDMGGFSVAPKFPRPGIFAFLNQLALHQPVEPGRQTLVTPRQMMKTTLEAMAAGGIYDQLAGGFHRYSVDENWQVPHFEKMLYSQALMVLAYSDFYQIEASQKYKQIVLETLEFVQLEMLSPNGGFYSALDAVSERHDQLGRRTEGAYYLWSEAELKAILSTAEFSFVKAYFLIGAEGNIFSDPHNEFTNLNIFHIEDEFRDRQLTKQEKNWWQSAKIKLKEQRHLRPRPQLDDKIITAWNGMMLAALARASTVFEQPEYLMQAEQTANFIKIHLYNNNGKLYRLYRQAHSASTERTAATLVDYVWLIYGLLQMNQISDSEQWLEWAFDLQHKQNELFYDNRSSAYFESMANDTSLLFRSKSIVDGALPSANAIALSNLRQLSALSNTASQKKILTTRANALVKNFARTINENPPAAAMLLAVEKQHGLLTKFKLP